jgi:hypothetical protein
MLLPNSDQQGPSCPKVPPDGERVFYEQDVREEELALIAGRRRSAGFREDRRGPEPSKVAAATGVREELVGLALSGGGIRSASFNLGLLQAFYRAGLLRYVDYLSTVSGGSYVGGWLSNTIRELPSEVRRDNLPLGDRPTGQQSEAVRRLVRAGHYLNHPLLLANRYLIGLLKTNLILGSLLLLGCATVAFAWRMLDTPPICETILVLTGGVLIEAIRPFMVAMILFLAWLIGWSLASRHRAIPSHWIAVAGVVVLVLLTFGLPVLEWWRGDIFLRPQNLYWRIFRPLPLLLLVAWLLAWCLITPNAASAGRAGKRATRFTARRYLTWLGLFVVVGIAGRLVLQWLPLSYFLEVFLVVVFVSVSGLYITIGGLQLLLGQEQTGPRPLHATRRLRWLLAAAGVALLVGAAVWFATPAINFVPTTSSDVLAPDEGSIERHRSWITPLFGALITLLLPFLRPQRLLESGLRPKRFWEPWVFRVACTAAAVGVPLLGIYWFSRHDLSDYNTTRGAYLLPSEVDWAGLWQRLLHEAETDPNSPGKILREKLDTAPPIHFATRPPAELMKDLKLAKIWREQPVPLSQQALREKYELTERLNHLAFSKETAEWFTNTVFQEPIHKQEQIEQAGKGRAAQWSQWPRLKLLLHEVRDKLPANDYDKEARAETHRQINRLLLQAHYATEISDKETVRRPMVVFPDQIVRFLCILLLVAVAVTAVRAVRLNITSLHWYYRDQLAAVYLGSGPIGGIPRPRDRSLSALDTATKGGPYHLINATLNVPNFRELVLRSLGARSGSANGCAKQKRAVEEEPKKVPAETNACLPDLHLAVDAEAEPSGCTEGFLFSQHFCGSEHTGFQRTDVYEQRGKLRLRDAVALSGAAVSLTQIDNPLILLFMAALNLRLGQWLPSPSCCGPRAPQRPPTAWDLWWDANDDTRRRHFFVSDGGHHDNLGLGVLLRRRCNLIIVSDATFDPTYSFADFRRIDRRERRERGVQLLPATDGADARFCSLDLDATRPRRLRHDYHGSGRKEPAPDPKEPTLLRGPEDRSLAHYFVARIDYGHGGDAEGPRWGYLIYLKPSFTGDENSDLLGHWAERPEFPHDPTSNQFFDENMVESYRELGEHIGERLWEDLREASREPIDPWQDREFKIHEMVEQLVERRGGEPPHPPPRERQPAPQPGNN